MMYNFFVSGIPVAQPRHRISKNGGRYISEDHSIHSWKEAIILEARKNYKQQIKNPVRITLFFEMKRPKNDFAKSGILKVSASKHHIKKPDIDNLQKSVYDALVDSEILKDDSLIIEAVTKKQYAKDNETFGVYVLINEVT